MEKKLYRSSSNRILAGVAGGLGEYFDIDPWIVRIFFILMHGAGLFIYIVLAIFLPESSAQPNKVETPVTSTVSKSFRRPGSGQAGQWIGAGLIILGALFLLDTLNVTYLFWPRVSIRDLWLPILVIFFGVFFLTRRET